MQSAVLGAVEADPERHQKGRGLAEAHRQLDFRRELRLRITWFQEGRFREVLSRACAQEWAGVKDPQAPPDDDEVREIPTREFARVVRAGQTKQALQRLVHPGARKSEQFIQTAADDALAPDGKVDLPSSR